MRLGRYGAEQHEAARQAPIQLAAGVALDDGTRTDATVELAGGPQPTMENGLEVAGPGPTTTRSFQDQVQDFLDVLAPEVATWWRHKGGEVRSRSATGWFTAWRWNDYPAVEGEQPIIVVDQHYTASMAAAAILRRVTEFGPFRDRFEQEMIPGAEEPERLSAAQRKRVQDAAGIAAAIAGMYVTAIGSLTPSGEVIVTLDDLSRNGFSWDQLLLALPLMVNFRKGVKSLVVKFSTGKEFRLSGEVLERLNRLTPANKKQLLAQARKAKTKKESLAIIKRGVSAVKKTAQALETNYSVYRYVANGKVRYVGMTGDMARRAGEHLRESKMQIEKVIGNLSKADARAVEQALIETHKLGKHDGTLRNLINSISARRPEYASQLRRGLELLESIGYETKKP